MFAPPFWKTDAFHDITKFEDSTHPPFQKKKSANDRMTAETLQKR